MLALCYIATVASQPIRFESLLELLNLLKLSTAGSCSLSLSSNEHAGLKGDIHPHINVESSRKALEMAKVKPEDVDLVLMYTSTPDDLFGGAPQVSII